MLEFVAVDKKRIFTLAVEKPDGYVLNGQYCGFFVPKERCVPIDDNEYAIILNLHGPIKAEEYAREKGYID